MESRIASNKESKNAYDNPPSNPPSPGGSPAFPGDEPPAYEPHAEAAGPDPDEILPAVTFAIHGRFIYQVLPSGEADSQPVYQLSRAIHAQGTATEKITFERLDPRVRTAADGSPAVSHRAKEIYELDYRKPMLYAGIPFQAWLEPRSRKGLGKVTLEKAPAFHHGYRAVREVSYAEKRWLERQGLPPVKKGEYQFAVKEHGEGWQWSDKGGTVVANQVVEKLPPPPGAAGGSRGGEEAGEVEYRLKVLAPLTRRVRDGLVALWCLWMWHIHVEENKPRKTWEDRKRILQMPRTYITPTLYG